MEAKRTEYVEIRSQYGALRGILHVGTASDCALIIGGHLASTKIGPNRLYFQIATRLSAIGINVLRLDLSGMGESDGELEHVCFEDHYSELETACEFLSARFRTRTLWLIAHCAGCYLATSLAIRHPKTITRVCLIAPFLPDSRAFREKLLGHAAYSSILSQGWAYRKSVFFHESFMFAANVLDDLSKLRPTGGADLMVAVPELDEYMPSTSVIDWCQSAGLPFKLVEGGDHNLLDLHARQALLENLEVWFRSSV